jgi:hypothetical protein
MRTKTSYIFNRNLEWIRISFHNFLVKIGFSNREHLMGFMSNNSYYTRLFFFNDSEYEMIKSMIKYNEEGKIHL